MTLEAEELCSTDAKEERDDQEYSIFNIYLYTHIYIYIGIE